MIRRDVQGSISSSLPPDAQALNTPRRTGESSWPSRSPTRRRLSARKRRAAAEETLEKSSAL
jgi:hypothetical protein